MPIIDDRTANRDYLLPNGENNLEDDVGRLRSTVTAIDLDVASILVALAGKAATLHDHGIGDITGLVTALLGKAAVDHIHSLNELSDVDVTISTNGQVLKRVGSEWVPASLQIGDVNALETALSGKASTGDVSTLSTAVSSRIVRTSATGSAIMPTGTTAERDASPQVGWERYNTTLGLKEVFNGSVWVPLDLSAAALKGANLSDLTDIPAARVNLGISERLAYPGERREFRMPTPPAGWFKENGAVVARAIYADLDAAIYCGDANNATAEWGYRTNSTDTVRSTTGTHLKLPDSRAVFSRGWDDGRGVDSGRSFWSSQLDAFKEHTHSYTATNAQSSNLSTGSTGLFTIGSFVSQGTSGASTGAGTETRPRNLVSLFCIKY